MSIKGLIHPFCIKKISERSKHFYITFLKGIFLKKNKKKLNGKVF